MKTLQVLKNKASFAVINLQDSDEGSGTHWLCFYHAPKNKYVYVFDSFGAPVPEDVKSYLKKFKKELLFNTGQIQNIRSSLCGYYCLHFINEMSKGVSYLDFIQSFDNGGDKNRNNDKKIKKIFNNIIDE